jgi:hypothetical protein
MSADGNQLTGGGSGSSSGGIGGPGAGSGGGAGSIGSGDSIQTADTLTAASRLSQNVSDGNSYVFTPPARPMSTGEKIALGVGAAAVFGLLLLIVVRVT